jgi:hypothetical protein
MQEKEIPLVPITRLEIDGIEHALILAALEVLDIDGFSHWEDETGKRLDDDYLANLYEKIERAEFNIWRTA